MTDIPLGRNGYPGSWSELNALLRPSVASSDETGPKRYDNATELRKGATGRPGGTRGGHAGGQKIKEASLLLSSATLLTWRGRSTNAQIWIIILFECKYMVGQKFHLGFSCHFTEKPKLQCGKFMKITIASKFYVSFHLFLPFQLHPSLLYFTCKYS